MSSDGKQPAAPVLSGRSVPCCQTETCLRTNALPCAQLNALPCCRWRKTSGGKPRILHRLRHTSCSCFPVRIPAPTQPLCTGRRPRRLLRGAAGMRAVGSRRRRFTRGRSGGRTPARAAARRRRCCGAQHDLRVLAHIPGAAPQAPELQRARPGEPCRAEGFGSGFVTCNMH